MNENENVLMVAIPFGRLEELLDIETRANVLIEMTKKSKYNIDREDIATVLDFELPAKMEGSVNE